MMRCAALAYKSHDGTSRDIAGQTFREDVQMQNEPGAFLGRARLILCVYESRQLRYDARRNKGAVACRES
jgi:hypothetical protein